LRNRGGKQAKILCDLIDRMCLLSERKQGLSITP
jgi:hypothetical protein